MSLLQRYLLRRLTVAFAATLTVFTLLVWLTQVLRQLDVVSSDGQALGVFLFMTLLALPSLIIEVAPLGFFFAGIFVLHGMNADNEIAVMSAAGSGLGVIARPVILFGFAVALASAAFLHIVGPASLKELRQQVVKVRTDLISSVVRTGEFRRIGGDLVVHVAERGEDGALLGIFLQSGEDGISTQYIARAGRVHEDGDRSYLVLSDGQLLREEDDATAVVEFASYALDLSRLAPSGEVPYYKPSERSTPYLLAPDPNDPHYLYKPERWRSELHARLSAPLYPIVYALLILVLFARPMTTRQGRAGRLVLAAVLGLALKGASFGAYAAVNTSASAVPVAYAVPLGAAVALLGVFVARHLRTRSRSIALALPGGAPA